MPTPDQIAETIQQAPAWAKIGLTMPQERLREDAAAEIARHLHTALYGAPTAELPACSVLPQHQDAPYPPSKTRADNNPDKHGDIS